MNSFKVLKNLKKHLVRKLILRDFYIDEASIYFELQMKNFRELKRNVEVQLYNKQEVRAIPFQLSKKKIMINLPLKLIERLDSKTAIEVIINGKKMWISEAVELSNKDRSFLVENQYFTIGVKKKIIINKKFTEYDFSNEKIRCTDIFSDGTFIGFNASFNLPPLFEFEIYAIQNNKIQPLTTHYNDQDKKIRIGNLTLLSNGPWRLFLCSNNLMYPLVLKEYQGEGSLLTYNHQVNTISHNGDFYLHLRPHFLPCTSVFLSKEGSDQISFHLETDLDYDHALLIMEDTKTREEAKYKLYKTSAGIFASISISDLCKDYSRKRFFIEVEDKGKNKYQFQLKKNQLFGPGIIFEKVIDSQIITFAFYVRKDSSLGLRIVRPVLKKEITEIKDFKITGYIGSLKKFVQCNAFLVFEERETKTNIRVPIKGEFQIDMASLNLVSLKDKGKNIIDLFVEIQDSEGSVVRKEKIKYKKAKYKKDNYYDHSSIRDQYLNIHHFLVTTTPFKNVKLESFVISKDISIPEDTYRKDDNIWLIGERYDTAQDNGIVLYHWLRKNTDIDAYYVIEKDSADYEKIKEDPHVLVFGSAKHFEIAVRAGVLLGTHDLENLLPFKTAEGFFHYENTYKVFLQHGVLGRKNVEYHKKYYDNPFDLFIVSSDEEKYDVVMDEMGYEESEVAVTGLARFDTLVQKEKPKNILLMPTWRDWIHTDDQFLESEYFTTYLNLLNNEELHQLLNEYNIKLHFYPHYRAQDFFQRNIKDLSSDVKFIPFGSKKVQELLIEHALLITDYSTVSFDYIKMGKPVIYYHFDVKRFFRSGILRPIEETFIGGIAYTEEEMISLIQDRLKNGLENYEADISGVIKYQDHSNCERIYHAIYKGLGSKRKAKVGSIHSPEAHLK